MLVAASVHAWGGTLSDVAPEEAGPSSGAGVRLGALAPKERRGFVLRLVDDAGLVGLGEATPLADRARRATLEALQHHDFAATQVPLGPSGLGPGHLRGPVDEGAARFAIEGALADLAARRAALPLSRWLVAGHPPRIARSAYLGAEDDPAVPARVEAAVARGISSIKLKAGAAEGLLERLDALVPRLRARVALRLDFNGTLSPEQAAALLPQLRERGIALVEEPSFAPARLPLGAAPPVYADESVPAQLQEILSSRLAGIVLKASRDGLGGALALAAIAREHGKRVIVTHAFEGPIALAHAAHLALALGGAGPEPGVDRHDALAAFPPLALPPLDEGPAWIVASAAPGLGVELDATLLGEAVWRWTR